MRAISAFCLLAAVLVSTACDDGNDLPDATEANAVDTVTLAALTGTPLEVPSAYSVSERRPVRTDQSSSFDLAFEIPEGGDPAIYPSGALGLGASGVQSGLFASGAAEFAGLTRAPQNGYVTDAPVAVDLGTVYAIRSRGVCGSGVPMYGKLEVLELDAEARTITVQVLTNNNCGYRSLTPGVPSE